MRTNRARWLFILLASAACVRWSPRPSPAGWADCTQSLDGEVENEIVRARRGAGELIVATTVHGEISEFGVGVFDDGEIVVFGGRGSNCCGLFARRISSASARQLRDELVAARLREHRGTVPADAPVGRIHLVRDDGTSEHIVFSPLTPTPMMERMWRRLHQVVGTNNALRPLSDEDPWPEPGTCSN